MNFRKWKNQNGFAALISTVLISSLLMIAAAVSVRTIFWSRFALLDRENKKISQSLAQACVQASLLYLTKEEKIPEDGWIDVVGADKCRICRITNTTGEDWEIIVRANYRNYYSNLEVKAAFESGKLQIKEQSENVAGVDICSL